MAALVPIGCGMLPRMRPALRRGLCALTAWSLLGPCARPASASEFRSSDGRFRARIERNQTYLWGTDRPAPQILAGYRQGPSLRSSNGTLGGAVDTAVFSADGRTVVVAGTCRGYSGVTSPRKPRCISGFIQLWDTETGTLSGVLEPYWYETHDESKVLALDISPDGLTVAALTRVIWSDCSYGGTELHLQVWTRADSSSGAANRSLWHRQIASGKELARTNDRYAVRLTPDAGVTVTYRVGDRSRSRVFSPPPSAPPRP